MSTGGQNKRGRYPSSCLRGAIRRPARQTSGFTLLEVLIALAILSVSLLILVSTQSSAARMSAEADRILIGTMLAKQRLSEIELALEKEPGFSEQDTIEEDGDFEQTFPGRYPEFRWHTVIRKLDLSGANTGGLGDMLGMGGAEEESDTGSGGSSAEDSLLSALPMDQISEELARFIREVKVTVVWMDGESAEDVTLTTHVIKPSPVALTQGADGTAIEAGGAPGGGLPPGGPTGTGR